MTDSLLEIITEIMLPTLHRIAPFIRTQHSQLDQELSSGLQWAQQDKPRATATGQEKASQFHGPDHPKCKKLIQAFGPSKVKLDQLLLNKEDLVTVGSLPLQELLLSSQTESSSCLPTLAILTPVFSRLNGGLLVTKSRSLLMIDFQSIENLLQDKPVVSQNQ